MSAPGEGRGNIITQHYTAALAAKVREQICARIKSNKPAEEPVPDIHQELPEDRGAGAFFGDALLPGWPPSL